jgi:hypothetical protein
MEAANHKRLRRYQKYSEQQRRYDKPARKQEHQNDSDDHQYQRASS